MLCLARKATNMFCLILSYFVEFGCLECSKTVSTLKSLVWFPEFDSLSLKLKFQQVLPPFVE